MLRQQFNQLKMACTAKRLSFSPTTSQVIQTLIKRDSKIGSPCALSSASYSFRHTQRSRSTYS